MPGNLNMPFCRYAHTCDLFASHTCAHLRTPAICVPRTPATCAYLRPVLHCGYAHGARDLGHAVTDKTSMLDWLFPRDGVPPGDDEEDDDEEDD